MICKMCLKEKNLVNSHIIPRSFFEVLKSDEKPLKIFSNKKDEFPKKSPIGIYDQIVCGDCEKLFQNYNNYAKEFLIDYAGEKQEVLDKGIKLADIIPKYDYDNLKLFFISVLWRASVSKNIYFEHVKTGPYESILRDMILKCDPGDEHTFSVILTRYETSKISGEFILDPRMTRIDHVNFYNFYLGSRYKIYIKIDKRIAPDDVVRVILQRNKPLYIIAGEFDSSRELELLRKLVRLKKNIIY